MHRGAGADRGGLEEVVEAQQLHVMIMISGLEVCCGVRPEQQAVGAPAGGGVGAAAPGRAPLVKRLLSGTRAAKWATLEATGSSTQGSGWAPTGA